MLALLTPVCPVRAAEGGRSAGMVRALCVGLFTLPLFAELRELPAPCGALPRSVMSPWAAQVRVALVDGGRFCEKRPDVRALVLTVCTGILEAAWAGAVRATTERLCTEDDGVATCPLALAEPMKLCRVGERPAPLVT